MKNMPDITTILGIVIGNKVADRLGEKAQETETQIAKEQADMLSKQIPKFKYNPFPIHLGIFQHHDEAEDCLCCGKPTNFQYRGKFVSDEIDDEEDELFICPDCIHSGNAAKKLNGDFIYPEFCDGITDKAKLDELCKRTPSYYSLMPQWLAHCGDFCALAATGISSWDEIIELGVAEEVEDDWVACEVLRIKNLKALGKAMKRGAKGYLFECLHCGKHRLYVDDLD